MRTRSALLATVAVLVLLVTSSKSSQAQVGCGYDGVGYGLAYGYGIGGLYNSLQFPLDYRVPYFAAHPPVYYSRPVPRTYGYSPFAYPPHFRTPEIVEPIAPVTMKNPYVPASDSPASEAKPADETVLVPSQPKPLVVVNPYVTNNSLAQRD